MHGQPADAMDHTNPMCRALGTQVLLLYGTLYIIFMCAIWWPVKGYWVYSGAFQALSVGTQSKQSSSLSSGLCWIRPWDPR